MKLPIFKNLQKNLTAEQLSTTLDVLEVYADSPSVKEEEMEVLGEMISNISGAMEMHGMISQGMTEKEAANAFMQRVLGSIDR